MNPSSIDFSDRRIALALSGGGVRAAAFHLGVLRFLGEHQLLEKVTYISTVSGGSLLAGMVFSQNDYRWPTSQEFQEKVHPAISHMMQRYDLQWSYIGRLFLLPWNWLRFAHRANVLADAIRATWKIRAPLSRLPPKPVWAINGTTMETGRRWRFRAELPTGDAAIFAMGDGELGETDASSFPLASAMATSAAFPGGISPLRIPACGRDWTAWRYSGKGVRAKESVRPLYSAYHVADGGVYDNLGLEPLFDVSKGEIRSGTDANFLLVSDAGAPLRRRAWGFVAQWFGFSTRTMDIMSTQTRHLRVRGLARFLIGHPENGLLLAIAQSAQEARDAARKSKPEGSVFPDLSGYLETDEVRLAANFPTTLHAMMKEDFDRIERNGYETCKIQFALYCGIDKKVMTGQTQPE